MKILLKLILVVIMALALVGCSKVDNVRMDPGNRYSVKLWDCNGKVIQEWTTDKFPETYSDGMNFISNETKMLVAVSTNYTVEQIPK